MRLERIPDVGCDGIVSLDGALRDLRLEHVPQSVHVNVTCIATAMGDVAPRLDEVIHCGSAEAPGVRQIRHAVNDRGIGTLYFRLKGTPV